MQVTFDGLDKPAFPTVPDFVKSLDLTRITEDPDIIVAYQMNGQPLPMLNGFPARLVVPGWYATYWVKNLSEIEVIDHVFEKFWMKPAYRIPDTPCGCVEPGTVPARTVPITRMTVRSFIAAPAPGTRVWRGPARRRQGHRLRQWLRHQRGAALDRRGDHMAARAARARPGPLLVPRVVGGLDAARARPHRLMVRAFNGIGESQGTQPLWNPAGYLRNVIEHVDVQAA